jgi:integrase
MTMPDGAAVIEYNGKRSKVWRVKYRDAAGVQVQETLGRASDGWTKRKAEAALRHRLADVERDGYRKPEPKPVLTFETFAEKWLTEYPTAKGLKRSTTRGYEQIVRNHLVRAFGSLALDDVTVEKIEEYLATKTKAGFSAGSLNRQVNVLSLILRAARRRGHVRDNPVALVDRPREQRRRWPILSPADVVAIERELDRLIEEAEDEGEREDRRSARVLFLTLMGTGVRRGEALGLHWRSVHLADPDGPTLRVEETWVRNAVDDPKSRAGERTIALGSRLAGELFEHRRLSRFQGDDERVFPNPRTGRAWDLRRYTEVVRLARQRAGVIGEARPCHDLRHSSITNAAAAGTAPEALMTRAGHASYATTRRYIDLAGERFRPEADRLEERLWGRTSTKNQYKDAASSSGEATEEAAIPRG